MEESVHHAQKSEKIFEMSMLLDFYAPVLTDPQKEALELFYQDDLTLAEIASETGITRQAVRDRLMKGERALRDMEEKLGLVRRFGDNRKVLPEVIRALRALQEQTGAQVEPIIASIEALIR